MAKQPSEDIRELFDFMVSKLGGESTVKSEFIKTKIASLDAALRTAAACRIISDLGDANNLKDK